MSKDTEEYRSKTNDKYKGLTIEQVNLIHRSFPIHSEYFDAMKFLIENYTFEPSTYQQVTDTQQLAYKRTAMFIKHLADKNQITKSTFLESAYEVAEKASGTRNLPSIYFSLTYFYNNAILVNKEKMGLRDFDKREKAGDINKEVREFIYTLTMKYKIGQNRKKKIGNDFLFDTTQLAGLSAYESLAIENGFEERVEKGATEKFIEENYVFQKDKRPPVLVYRDGLVRRIAFLIDYMVDNNCIDNIGLIRAFQESFNGPSNMYHNSLINRELLYFYNEAIPIEAKEHIFTYKKRFKPETQVNDIVRNKVLNLAKKYQKSKQKERKIK